MSHLKITDNHDWKKLSEVEGYESITDLDNLRLIANVKIDELSINGNSNLLVFPHDFKQHGDKISENIILSLSDESIKTGNILGFVGIKDTQMTICSRFDNGESDYFMHYMLQKVFAINLFDLKHSKSADPIFDFLIYLFPYYLKKAIAQGLFKKYCGFEHNDTNVRGTINITQHIRRNIPFRGAVAYTTREHSYDNELTQLVRHTIEFIQQKAAGKTILSNDADTKNCVSQIVMATPSYSFHNRTQIVQQNIRPIRHPYYSEYIGLQKICLQILRHESIKFGQEKERVYGVLFDGAWLWEEYLNTILKQCGFNHPQNKKASGGFHMFENPKEDVVFDKNSRQLYPDFWKENFILDAKYKHLNNGVGREDLYQVVSYMYCKQSPNGGYVYPFEHKTKSVSYKLVGYGGKMTVIPFHVPQSTNNWKDFISQIQNSEKELLNSVTL